MPGSSNLWFKDDNRGKRLDPRAFGPRMTEYWEKDYKNLIVVTNIS